MIRVSVQAIENYADNPLHGQYWKFKGGQDILVTGTDDRPANAVALAIEWLDCNVNSPHSRYCPISWEVDNGPFVKQEGVMAYIQMPRDGLFITEYSS